jgi:uncharacterized protein DUF5985
MATSVYILCTVTSAFCAALLFREYRRSSARLLLWSSLSFMAWALNNALVFMDLVMLPDVDLLIIRTSASLVAVSLMLYGLVWDAA